MNRLQVEIDEESETRTELYEERSKAKDRKKKAFVESLLVSRLRWYPSLLSEK